MAHIPQSLAKDVIPGLPLRNQGKVRNTYDLSVADSSKMGLEATNRISIFDYVLNARVPQKGEVLTALNHFWLSLLGDLFETDFVACGNGIDAFLPSSLCDNPALQKRLTVVERYPEPDVEDVVRLYLTGSGWKTYQENREVCGQRLPDGLIDGSRLPYPLYTPTTKAKTGHDEHITADSVAQRYGHRRERMALQAAGLISSYAESCGIILADTKFEISFHDGRPILVDEKGTPDSSRFWDAVAYKKAIAKGALPPSLDKQHVRNWGKEEGIDKLKNPDDPEQIKQVQSLTVPETVLSQTHQIYRYILWRLTGQKLEAYQREKMNIAVDNPPLNILILIGSKSDVDQLDVKGLAALRANNVRFRVDVLSCHRNVEELPRLLEGEVVDGSFDRIIAGAGMAAALPGIVKSHLCRFGRSDIPVIGVAFNGSTPEATLAAQASIEQLPEQPVELDQNGKAYTGRAGFQRAFVAAVCDEFLPKMITHKPYERGILESVS